MATIPATTKGLRHVRKSITFNGGANLGNLGDDVPVFTTTGRVLITYLTMACTTSLTGSNSDTTLRITSSARDQYAIPRLLGDAVSGTIGSVEGGATGFGTDVTETIHTASNVVLAVEDGGAGADVTGGTIVIDAWYRPITDDGALAGDDIDTAGDYVSGMAASTIDAAAFAAGAITATVIASNAIDADALASDAVTEIWAKAMSDLAAVPSATASVLDAINWMFELARNKRTQSSTTETLYKDDGSTALATSTKSDNGTTYTRGEFS